MNGNTNYQSPIQLGLIDLIESFLQQVMDPTMLIEPVRPT